MNLYASLEDIKLNKSIETTDAIDDNRLLLCLITASRRIDDYCARIFYPQIDTKSFDYKNPWEIRFDPFDLVEATTVTTANGNTTIDSGDYYLMTGKRHDLYPKDRLVLRTDSGVTLNVSDRYQQANQITGVWVTHDDWPKAWRGSLDTIQSNPLTSGGTSLTVNDADGADARGITKRFSLGQLLAIESEYVYVAGVSISTNVLTIVRAQNGTTAVAHVQNTAITIFQPIYAIWQACLLAASYFYQLPEAPFGTVQSLEDTYTIPLTLPQSAVELIEPWRRFQFGTAEPQAYPGRLYPNGENPLIGV